MTTLSPIRAKAEQPAIEFDGETYRLAWVNVAPDGAVTNEYVKSGETVDAWTTLLTVRLWPRAKLGEAASGWLKAVGPLLTKKAEAFKPKTAATAEDVIFEAWLSAPDRSYIEPNFNRFVAEPGPSGVKSYQFAEKIVMKGGTGDPTRFIERRAARMTALGKLELAVHRVMGEPSAAPALKTATAVVSPQASDLTVEAAVQGAADNADGFEGTFLMTVRGSGRSGTVVLLNSEADYRRPTCLTVAIPSKVGYYVGLALGSDFKDSLIGKRVRVTGVARRESIRTTRVNGKAGNYFQTQIQLESADRLQVVGP